MKTSTQRIYTSDNLELFGLLYEPDSGSKTILVHVHGMAGNFCENLFLDYIAKTLTDNGISFFTFNNRGCEYIKDLYKINGERRNIVRMGNTFEKFEDCLLDIQAAIDFVKSKGYSSVHLSGHSLGGPKVAYYVTEKNDQVESVIFISPADMVGLAINEKNFDLEYNTAQKMIADGKGNEIMPFTVWGDSYLSADTYMSLSDKKSKVAIFNIYNPEDELEVLSKIKIPAYVIMGRKDSALTIKVKDFMDRVSKALSNSSNVETNILDDANHGYMGYEQRLADALLKWIKII